jgi:hypothetical protein
MSVMPDCEAALVRALLEYCQWKLKSPKFALVMEGGEGRGNAAVVTQ